MPFEITNDAGILLFLDPEKTTTITGLPTPTRVDEVESICSYYTPVPGGVGPMTRASLLMNTLLAAEKSIYK